MLPVPPATMAVDLGAGAVATLASDGSFSIVQGGTTLVTTSAGTPLFARTSDPDDPDGWHDPTSPDPSLAVLPIDLTTVTAESVDDGSSTKAIHLVVPAQPDDTALLSLTLAADDGFTTGLGEQFTHVSASGRVTPMFLTIGGSLESGTNEAHVPVPFLVSSRGWGLFVATREAGAFDVGATNPQAVTATFEGRSLDVWFFVDPDPLSLVARYNRLAGLPRPLPRWALSLLHWRHWASADDVLSIAGEYRTRHIPTSALWFDDGWQTSLNDYTLSPAMFGDPQALMAQIGALGYRVMAWTSPYLEHPKGAPADPAQVLYEQGLQGQFFVQDGDGNVFVPPTAPVKASTASGAAVPDFTDVGARAFWENIVANATRTNFHGFKCDYGEDFIPNLGDEHFPMAFSDGMDATTAGRVFPVDWHATEHAVLDEAFPGDGLLIVRASSWGGASEADVIWPGDLDPQFEHQGDALPGGGIAVGGLPAVLVDAQTLGVSGFSAFGSDTTGYRGTPTRESTLRWMEHTALTVVMQVYEDGSRLPWLYDDAAGAEYQAMATLHQQLEPYNAILVRGAQTAGTTTIRPLPLAFPADPATFAVADTEYLLGPDLLVAPVITAGATNASVHLPPGPWVHWWSDQVFQGPADVTVDAPLGSPPLFARGGGLVPMLPADIDTLVEASAPGVVTLASQAAEMQGRAWAMGASSVVLDDGAAIAVSDAADGVTVTWTAGASATNLTLDVDLRVRSGGASDSATVATLAGRTLAPVASPAALAGSPTPAWAPGNPGHVTLRFVGSGAARLQ
ncbi:MAG: TIM-barrel domain-containing protein [Polyangiaceae bacterium]